MRPNIIIFMVDQQRADCVGAFGNPVVQTPNIDALAARGVRFDNAWCQHPVCGPSRVSFMTGSVSPCLGSSHPDQPAQPR